MADIDLKQIASTSISNEFWEDFLDALSEECTLMRTEIAEKKDFFNVRNQTDTDRLVELNKTYGFYYLDRSIDTSTDFLKRNLYTIVSRHRYRTTYQSYKIAWSLIKTFGKVYNYFKKNDDFLARGIDTDQIYTNLTAVTDYSEVFRGFEELPYYKGFDVIEGYTLDWSTDLYLDESEVTTLDIDYARFPTNHLAVEYNNIKLITEDSTEYLMTSTYLDYMDNISKNDICKATEYPHIGAQYSFIIDYSGYYNNLSLDADYTIPDLKIQAVSTYLSNYEDPALVSLDVEDISGEYEMDLDKSVVFTLNAGDSSADFLTGTMSDMFYSIDIGNYNKKTPSSTYPNLNLDLMLYLAFDTTSVTSTITDYSTNEYDGTLYGAYERKLGISGNGIELQGTGYGLIEDINFSPTVETFTFYMKGLASNNSGTITLMHVYDAIQDYLQLQYNCSTGDITLSMTGNTIVYNEPDLLDNNTHHFAITYNAGSYELFLDGVSVGTQTSGGSLPSAGFFDLYLGVDQGLIEYSYVLIDELRWYAKILSDNEIGWLYDNAGFGDLNNVGNLLMSLNSDHVTILEENSYWKIISVRVDFKDAIDTIISTYSTTAEIKMALNTLYNEEFEFNEILIRDSSGNAKLYASLDASITMKKDNHISFQFLVKKT